MSRFSKKNIFFPYILYNFAYCHFISLQLVQEIMQSNLTFSTLLLTFANCNYPDNSYIMIIIVIYTFLVQDFY